MNDIITDINWAEFTAHPVTPEAAHCMVDLETLSTDPYAPILSIGAVRFRFDDKPIHPDDLFYQVVDLQSCMDLGLRPSASTIKWWAQQSDHARSVVNDETAVSLPEALDRFTEWWNSRPDEFWGNSV